MNSLHKDYKPVVQTGKNPQLDMFCAVTANPVDIHHYSNALTFWDSLPKFFIHRRKQAMLRSDAGTLEEVTQEFEVNGEKGCITLLPAYNKKDNKRFEYFLSEEEEVLEQVLRKIFVQQNTSFKEDGKRLYGVRFTLKMLQRELKSIKRTRSITEIKTALVNLRRASFIVKCGNLTHEGSIISNLYEVNKSAYEDDSSEMWFATFSETIADSINQLLYRQFNYTKTLHIKSQVGRWLYKKMSTEFINCSVMTSPIAQGKALDTWKVSLATIVKESCLFYGKPVKEVSRLIKNALNEMVKQSLIADFESENVLEGRKCIDVEFSLKITSDFVKEMKQFNLNKKQKSEYQILN